MVISTASSTVHFPTIIPVTAQRLVKSRGQHSEKLAIISKLNLESFVLIGVFSSINLWHYAVRIHTQFKNTSNLGTPEKNFWKTCYLNYSNNKFTLTVLSYKSKQLGLSYSSKDSHTILSKILGEKCQKERLKSG